MQHQTGMIPLTYEFRGGMGLGVKIGAFLLSVVTLGLGVPWAKTMKLRWLAENTYVNGQPLRFTGTGGQLWGQYIKWWALSVVTLGIYAFFVSSKLRKWAIEHQAGLVPVHP